MSSVLVLEGPLIPVSPQKQIHSGNYHLGQLHGHNPLEQGHLYTIYSYLKRYMTLQWLTPEGDTNPWSPLKKAKE